MKFVYLNGTNYNGYAAYDVEHGAAKTMTVADLIAKLATMPQDAAVIYGNAYNDSTVESVESND